MLIYLAIKYHADRANRAKTEAISRALAQKDIETVCVARDVEQWGAVELAPDELMRQAFAAIDGADALLVDLTEKGVGLGIEAGYAYARGIPIVTVAETGADVSTTLRGISQCVLLYQTIDDLTAIGSMFRDSSIEDHDSGVLSDEFYSWLVEETAKTLKPLI